MTKINIDKTKNMKYLTNNLLGFRQKERMVEMANRGNIPIALPKKENSAIAAATHDPIKNIGFLDSKNKL